MTVNNRRLTAIDNIGFLSRPRLLFFDSQVFPPLAVNSVNIDILLTSAPAVHRFGDDQVFVAGLKKQAAAIMLGVTAFGIGTEKKFDRPFDALDRHPDQGRDHKWI